VEVKVLGPMEVWSHGRLLTVGSAKQRTLLATLVLNANRMVATDRLIEVLWDGDPPAAAKSALPAYVYRLRNAISGQGPDVSLRSCPSGYALTLPADAVDAVQFDRMASAGQQAATQGRLPDAADILRSALRLWRGQALEDVRGDVIRAFARRLDERRLTVAHQWAQAALAIGRHASVLTDLPPLVAEHPLHEGLRASLMTALYRDGRQAEALASYADLRQLLVDELGIEPARQLQSLRQRILINDAALLAAGSDPALATSAPNGVKGRQRVRQLPPLVSPFVGRDDEVAWLSGLIEDVDDHRMVVCAIVGPAGVGKSALARCAAHAVAGHLPDCQLYLDLGGAAPGSTPMTVLDALRRMLGVLGLDDRDLPTTAAGASSLLRSCLGDRRPLLVLDNARDVAQVRELLPVGAGGLTFVTSRNVLSSLEGAAFLHIDPLPSGEAVALLRALVGAGRVDAEPQAARSVARCCAGLPLALQIAGARLAARPAWPLQAFADRIADPRDALDQLQTTDLALRACLDVSYTALACSDHPVDRGAARLFRLMGLREETSIDIGCAAALLDQPPNIAEAWLERLADGHLLETAVPGSYRMSDFLWVIARERLLAEEPEQLRRQATYVFSLGLRCLESSAARRVLIGRCRLV